MSDKKPFGIFSALQLDGDFVSPYPRPQSKDMCIGSHLHGHNVIIFHHLPFTAHCEFSIFPAEPLRQERSIE